MKDVHLYTKKQLAQKFHKTTDSIIKILGNVTPDGMCGRWVGFSEETYKKAESEYLQSMDQSSIESMETDDPDLGRQKLEMEIKWKAEQTKRLKLENDKEENLLVNRDEVEDLLCFQSQLFTDKIKELTKDKPDLFNIIITEVYSDLEAYINDKKIQDIVNDDMLVEVNEVLHTTKHNEEVIYEDWEY